MLTLALLFAQISAVLLNEPDANILSEQPAAVIWHNLVGPEATNDIFLNLDQLVAAAISERTETETATSTEAITPEAGAEPLAKTDIRETTVKIECVQKADGYKRIVTGTGFIINPYGVILTNAHVAQFLLLKNAPNLGETTCQATIGSAAEPIFDIGLLYISPSWLLEHASLIGSTAPKGTGESDFALVYITGKAGGLVVDQDFSYLPSATNPLSKSNKDKTVTIVGYPKQADKSASQLIATTTITDLYTFGSGYADIFSLASSSLGHQGASGGPVVDEYGRAIGVITTKDAGTTVLNAITTAHIDRRLLSETGFDLTSYSTGNIDYKAQLFNETISPILQEILAGYLLEQNP
jgi:S1-C subfamily serine protease